MIWSDSTGNRSEFSELNNEMDEAQLEASRSLVELKMFETDEEASQYSDGRVWSEIGHTKSGKPYRGYCLAGELAVQSVTEAGEYYNLNVPLTAGYVLGKSWGDTH